MSVGGTGKTPFTAYLINDLVNAGKEIAVVSRGYGRLSKGLKEVNNRSNASEVGDEPLLLKQRYPKVHVWVAEKREWGVKAAEDRGVDVILLDDDSFNLCLLFLIGHLSFKYLKNKKIAEKKCEKKLIIGKDMKEFLKGGTLYCTLLSRHH